MAAPTEILAEDIRDLRESLRKIHTDMVEIRDGQTALRTDMKWMKGAGRLIIGLLIAAIGCAAGIIWTASAVYHRVEQHATRLDRVEQQLTHIIDRIDRR